MDELKPTPGRKPEPSPMPGGKITKGSQRASIIPAKHEPSPIPGGNISYRPKKAAELLGVSVSFLYVLMVEGRLPYTQVGGIRLISHEALHALVNSYSQKGVDHAAALR